MAVLIADAKAMPVRGSTQLPPPQQIDAARSQLREVVASYDEALRPAGNDFAIAALGILAASYPPVRRSAQEASIAAEVFVSEFASWPRDILAEAVRRAIRSCRYFPTVSELRDDRDIDGPAMQLAERQQDRDEFARWAEGTPPRSTAIPFGASRP